MTVKELVINLVLNRGTLKAEISTAKTELTSLADAGICMGDAVAESAADAAKSLQRVETAGELAGQEVAQGASEAAKSLKKVESAGEKAGREIAEGAKKGGQGYERLTSILVKAAAILGAVGLAKGYIEQAAALDQTAQSLGMNVESLQEWQGAARMAGGEAEEMADRFRDMADYMTDATKFDSGPLKEIASTLGIGLTDATGKARDTEAVMLDLADAFQRVGAQQAMGYGMQLGFDPGTIALLQKGRGEVTALMARQKEMGLLTKKDTEAAQQARLAMGALGQSLYAMVSMIMRWVTPALTWMAEKLTDLVLWVRKHENFIVGFFAAVGTVIAATLIPKLYALAAANLAAWWPLLLIGAAVVAVGALIGLLVDDFLVWAAGGESMFGDFWAFAVQVFDNIKAAVLAFFDFVAPIWEAVKQIGMGVWHAIVAAFHGDMDGLQAAFVEIWDGIKNYLLEWVDVIKGIILGLWEWIKGMVGNMGKAIAEMASGLKNSAQNAVSGAWDSVKDGVSGLLSFGGTPSAAQSTAGGHTGRNVQAETRIGSITVNTQASDADGIARDLGSAIREDVMQHDYAMGY